MTYLTKSKVMRTLLGTAFFGALAFGLAACPEEEPAVNDDPVVDEEPENDVFEDDMEDDDDI
jgi:hypothetical protein